MDSVGRSTQIIQALNVGYQYNNINTPPQVKVFYSKAYK